MNSSQINPQKKTKPRRSSATASVRRASCQILLSRSSVRNTAINMVAQNQVSSTVVAMSTRNSRPATPRPSVIQELQSVQDSTLESLYEDQMNRSIEGMVSSLKTTFKKNVNAFIGAVEAQITPNVYKNEVARMKANHANEIADLKKIYYRRLADIEAKYRAKLEKAERDKDLAVTEAKKKLCCPGCGKGTKQKMMMFCNIKCQKKAM